MAGKKQLHVESVAVIGAGISGVVAAVHLKRAGLNVTVFERSSRAGGVWLFDKRRAKDAPYPSVLPSTGDSPADIHVSRKKSTGRADSPIEGQEPAAASCKDITLQHAPPGPCYNGLKNNVSTIEMEVSCQPWPTGTEEFVPHHVLAAYIQETAKSNRVENLIKYNTKVERVQRARDCWLVETSTLDRVRGEPHLSLQRHVFDAIVVASGHYHACKIPDFPGLEQWKKRYPDRVQHSKRYRRPDGFKDQNVLIVGAGVSSTDMAKELGPIAKTVYQSSRSGPYDLPSHLLPANAARVSAVAFFDALPEQDPGEDDTAPIPGSVTLVSGERLCNIHQVILATGYHVSFPFMRQYHDDEKSPAEADEEVLVTDGQQTHNLHKDIFYIPDPTLSFIGVPYHVATFSFFEFQAQALAQVLAGRVTLPQTDVMRKEYNEKLRRKGAGREFHSLKKEGDEIAYVDELVRMVNKSSADGQALQMTGHTVKFHESYARRRIRTEQLFALKRDPRIDQEIVSNAGICS
ncbi:FAD/NAD(P)-binding domain-containing protein [Teratosphaeria nubilosa]|uniref:FAD/NAD(P)-binding domain-containing protein n=1 Tax=Teratosphaeria nubilosa TaxID=161662 RepID=A0A6G1LA22_9PEZI|nr:FAD/NAD(P)-binding domain-containing protein [Teratosphaeria nubilosa]